MLRISKVLHVTESVRGRVIVKKWVYREVGPTHVLSKTVDVVLFCFDSLCFVMFLILVLLFYVKLFIQTCFPHFPVENRTVLRSCFGQKHVFCFHLKTGL